MSRRPIYVGGDETIVWVGRPTLRAIASHAIGAIVFVLLLGSFILNGLRGGADLYVPALSVVLLLVLAGVLALQGLRLRRTEFVLTDQAVYARSGLIGENVAQITYEKITDTALKQDVLGRVFGYATLQLNTAGSNLAPVQMVGLRDALRTKQAIEAARERALGRGAASPRGPPHRSAPTFLLTKDVATLRCPTTKATFKRPRAELGSRVACPLCHRQHVAKEA